jgi:hypothetical protein
MSLRSDLVLLRFITHGEPLDTTAEYRRALAEARRDASRQRWTLQSRWTVPYLVHPDGSIEVQDYEAIEQRYWRAIATGEGSHVGLASRVAPTARSATLADLETHGRATGRRFGGDPWRCARAERIPVEMLYPSEIAARTGKPLPSSGQLYGRLVAYTDGSARIFINRDLDTTQTRETLTHELAHHHHHAATEPQVRQWARAFLGA